MNGKNGRGLRKQKNMRPIRCPYCGSPIVYRSADGIYKENKGDVHLYVCTRYPECDSYVRVHAGTNIPVGTLANQKLRTLRRSAHQYFDQLYLSGIMSKEEAYSWLAYIIQAPMSQAHIGHLGEYYCQLVIDESKKLLDSRKRVSACRHLQLIQGGNTV